MFEPDTGLDTNSSHRLVQIQFKPVGFLFPPATLASTHN